MNAVNDVGESIEPRSGGVKDHAANVVSFVNVRKTYEADTGVVEAIRDVSGSIRSGRFVSIVGPSGCGKTTLLNIVGGLDQASDGAVTIDGTPIKGPRRDIGMVFQEDSTLHWRSVLDNVAFGLEVAGVGKEERIERARKMIQTVGLGGFEQHRPPQLSGGMKQRVSIARALVMRPRILLMDEPFGALDQQTRTFVGHELVRIWEESQTNVLFVTHDIAEAVYLSDEVWVLSHRPSVVREVVEIDLGRPRPAGTARSARFHEYTDHLWSLISDAEAKSHNERGR
jgi:NitT/TauT family transport system ATP-binding protein